MKIHSHQRGSGVSSSWMPSKSWPSVSWAAPATRLLRAHISRPKQAKMLERARTMTNQLKPLLMTGPSARRRRTRTRVVVAEERQLGGLLPTPLLARAERPDAHGDERDQQDRGGDAAPQATGHHHCLPFRARPSCC